MYFSIDGERVGYCLLVLLDLQELELDQQFLTYLKPYFLQAEEFVDVASPARSNQSIVTDLLSGAGGSPEAIRKFLKSTDLGSPFQLLEIHSNGIVNYTQRSMLVRDLKELDIPLFAMEYDKRVLILTEAAHIRQLAQRISETINTGTGHLSIGISMPFSSLEKLCAAHLQSVFAIEETGYQDGFFYCRDFAFNYLLRILQWEELTKNLLHPAVEILSRYDQKNGSDLLSTLRVYMEQGMNQIHTANALFIHRNTLKYRLAKISELTDIDLSDPDEKLYLSLSLRLS
jgi:sugar diacid utilization regulator